MQYMIEAITRRTLWVSVYVVARARGALDSTASYEADQALISYKKVTF